MNVSNVAFRNFFSNVEVARYTIDCGSLVAGNDLCNLHFIVDIFEQMIYRLHLEPFLSSREFMAICPRATYTLLTKLLGTMFPRSHGQTSNHVNGTNVQSRN